MIIDTLSNNPAIGAATSLGSAWISWLGVLNPILSFVYLCVGIAVGTTTLIIQVNKIRKKWFHCNYQWNEQQPFTSQLIQGMAKWVYLVN